MKNVHVLNDDRTPLMPTSEWRAWHLIARKRAVLFSRFPLTIIMTQQIVDPAVEPMALKLDPGTAHTGVAVTCNDVLVEAKVIEHRGHWIVAKNIKRSNSRHGRRARNTRYRTPRFKNRTRKADWVPNSYESILSNMETVSRKIIQTLPITTIEIENVRFDTQKLANPKIKGIQYRQGTLLGYEVKEYLLIKSKYTCEYCDSRNVVFEVDHIHPKSKGGSNRISNLTIACCKCNHAKNNQRLIDFLKNDAQRAQREIKNIKANLLKQHKPVPKTVQPIDPYVREKRVRGNVKKSLRDAGMLNAIRFKIVRRMQRFGLPISLWTGGRTKMNRTKNNYPKEHWVDAACVGKSGANVVIHQPMLVETVVSRGHGSRQSYRVDKHGFPINSPKVRWKRKDDKGQSSLTGFQTGDMIKAIIPRGKYQGSHIAMIVGTREKTVELQTATQRFSASYKYLKLLQRGNGYAHYFSKV